MERAARVFGLGLRRVEVEDGVRDADMSALVVQLERAARAVRAQSNGHEPAVERPADRVCRVCGVRPAARQRTICRSRACEQAGYQHGDDQATDVEPSGVVTLEDLRRVNARLGVG
ncbi:MAG: hypothetical protein ACRD03_01840 [Acidimicrobiales bacterium]